MSSDDHEHGERVGRYRVEWAAPGRRTAWRWVGSYEKPESAQRALSEVLASGARGRVIEEAQARARAVGWVRGH